MELCYAISNALRIEEVVEAMQKRQDAWMMIH